MLEDEGTGEAHKETAKTNVNASFEPMQSSNPYLTTQSLHKKMAEMAKLSNDPEVTAYMLRGFNHLFMNIQEMVMAKHAKTRDFKGDVVSACIPIDRRRKCVRIKGGYEKKLPVRMSRKAKHSIEGREPTHFSVDSVIQSPSKWQQFEPITNNHGQ